MNRRPPAPPTKRLKQVWTNFYAAARDMPQQPVAPERKKAVQWEHIEQVEVIKWWKEHCGDYGLPELSLFAVPNAGKRPSFVGEKLRAEGMRTGAPDLILAYISADYFMLAIEMKREKGGVQSDEQKDFEKYLNASGYRYVLCPGADAAIQAITQYLEDA